jgi:hypothetical protein
MYLTLKQSQVEQKYCEVTNARESFKNGYLFEETYTIIEAAKEMLNATLRAAKYGWGTYITDGDILKMQTFEPRGNEMHAVLGAVQNVAILQEDKRLSSYINRTMKALKAAMVIPYLFLFIYTR